jgi:hypothetical protein
VLDALPPSFEGGRRTTESICLKARDMMFAQIGQLVGNDDTSDGKEGRRLVAEYLKVCLDEYIQRGCTAPEWGEPFTPLHSYEKKEEDMAEKDQLETDVKEDTAKKWGKGNVVFRRPDEDFTEAEVVSVSTVDHAPMASVPTSSKTNKSTSSQQLLQEISKSQHAPGVRRAGCPCCDPDGSSNYVDKMMGL